MTVPDTQRIVVTGMGALTPIGLDVDALADSLLAGRHGLRPVDRRLRPVPAADVVDVAGYAGIVEGFEPLDFDGRGVRRLRRSDEFAIAATHQALARAGYGPGDVADGDVAVSIGICQLYSAEVLDLNGLADLSISPADAVAAAFRLAGPRSCPSNACAAGSTALGLARDELLRGRASIAIAGGVDALEPATFGGFSSLQSIAPGRCSPYGASDGLSLGEGAGILVIETLDHALRRGAEPLCELAGCGGSADAYHPTAPEPTGRGAVLAMSAALRDAGLEPDDIDYVNGHGTGTAANDAMERRAFRRMFGERASALPISSTKSMIGHTLGAAGAIEAIACILAITRGFVPPTHGLEGPDPTFDFVPDAGRRGSPRATISTSYAFGGSNAAVVMTEVGRARRGDVRADEGVEITGIGLVGPLGDDVAAWWKAIRAGDAGGPPTPGDGWPLTADGVAPRGLWRRLDRTARMAVAASGRAIRNAGLATGGLDSDTAIVIASALASSDTVLRFAALVADPGDRGQAGGQLFAQVPANAPAGHLSSINGFCGPTLSVSNGGLSGHVGIGAAVDLLSSGTCRRAVVVGVDHVAPELLERLRRSAPDLLSDGHVLPFSPEGSGTVLCDAAVALVLERAGDAARRDGRPYARVLGMANQGVLPRPLDLEGQQAAWRHSMGTAMERAAVSADGVELVVGAGTGVPALDRPEATALRSVFGGSVEVLGPKAATGETLAAATGVNVLAALGGIGSLDTVGLGPGHVAVVNTTGFGAACASIVLGSVA